MRLLSSGCFAAILVAMLAVSAWHDGHARVVRDGRTAPNPVVEAGGVRLRAHHDPAVQYSLVGAIAADAQRFLRCAVQPFWSLAIIPGPWFPPPIPFDGRPGPVRPPYPFLPL